MNNNRMPSAQAALRRLLIVLAVVVGVLVYAYGWQVTDISLEETQEPTRQESMQRALRELLAPDIFDQERDSEFAAANFAMGCPEGGAATEQPPREEGQPYVVISPQCGGRNDLVTVEGFGFHADADAFLRWVPPSGQARPLVRRDIDDSGYFITQVEVPGIRGSEGEVHQIQVEGSWPIGLPYPSQTTYTVIEKIVETIFLALMATTLAVPVAVVLSFLAARNLMRQVRLLLGNVLVGVILLPIGWALGAALLTPVGTLGVQWGRDLLMGVVGPVVAVAGYSFVARVANGVSLSANSLGFHVRRIALNILLIVVGVFVLGALGGIGVWLGERLQSGLLADLGQFVGTLGTLIELIIGLIAALAAAFLVASVGIELTRDGLKVVPDAASHVLGGALGVLGGGLLMALCALIANQAALLGLLPPLIAAVLAVPLVMMVYNRVFDLGKPKRKEEESDVHQTARLALGAAAALLVFFLAYFYLDTSRMIVDGRLPASLTWDLGFLSVQTYTGKAALIGAILGGIGSALAGTHAAFPLGMTLYNVTRTTLNAIRAIEPLIMGIVFVIWVGIGPFAGVLALMLHSIAALGKLYSEQTENIDAGPIEAIQATGANRLQTIVYAVVPQIVPPYIAFTMYRWDINVRMSTIIGFVGGGGIGFLLQQQINLLRYRDAGVAVLAIAIVVSVLDYASASIRERLV